MYRHTAFFMFKEDITPEQHLAMRKGLAYMRYECPTVLALDYGTDLFGGSIALRTVKPWMRTPRWRSRAVGPVANYDVALQLDFADEAGNTAYNNDDVHHEVGAYNASICRGELTARVDWEYEGDVRNAPGQVRHSAMFIWGDGVSDGDKQTAFDAVAKLESTPEVSSVLIGRNVGTLSTDFDWIFDIQVSDKAACLRLIETESYAEAMKQVAAVTKYEWTARISHVMHGL